MPNSIISVVMPCLNGMPHLPSAIASVRSAFPGVTVEIVVADGGSNDGSVEYLRAQDVTLLEGPDGSLYAGLNKAIAAARGDYLLWLNSDDVITGGAAKLLSAAVKSGADITTGEAEIATGDRVTWRSDHAARQVTAETLLFAVPTINSRIFARQFIERAGPFRDDIGLGADRHFLLCLLRLNPRRIVLAETIYRYQSHPLSRTMGGSWSTYRSVHDAHLVMVDALRPEMNQPEERALLDAFENTSRMASVRASFHGGDRIGAMRLAAGTFAGRPNPFHWWSALALRARLRHLSSGW